MAVQNNVAGTLFVQLQPIATGFNAQVQALLNNAAQNATVEVNVEADTSRVQSGLDAINQRLIAAAANTALFEEGIRRIGGVVNFVNSQFGGLFDTLVKARLGFENLLGEQAGEDLLEQIRVLAKETPFTNNVLIKYSQQLLAVGTTADEIIPTLQAVGDLIFTVGGGTENLQRVLYALSQVQATGRLIGQDARQFQDALIPIQRYIADFLGTSIAQVQDLQRLGQISAETVFASLRAAAEPVAGALQNANQTIEGALEILTGTLETFVQDQPVLQSIFESIVGGINSITQALESEDFQQKIASLFSGLESTLTRLQPLFQGMREAFGAGFITFLDATTSALGILADVLNMIPEPVLRALGIFFVTLSALKLPVVFLGYVKGITDLFRTVGNGQLVNGLAGTAGGIQTTGQAAQRATSRLAAFNAAAANMTGRLTALSAAAAVAGVAIQQAGGPGNQTTNVLGGALTGAASGAVVGSAIAPGVGTAIGAVGGAILGGVTSYFTSARQEVESFQQELQERGAQAAEEFVRQFSLQFQGDLGSDLARGTFFGQLDTIRRERDDLFSSIDELQAERARLEEQLLVVEDRLNQELGSEQGPIIAAERERVLSAISDVDAAIDRQDEKVAVLRSTRDQLFGTDVGQQYENYYKNVASALQIINRDVDLLAAAGLRADSVFTNIFARDGQTAARGLLGGDVVADSTEDIDALTDALEGLGLKVEDVIPSANTTIDDIIRNIKIGLGIEVVDSVDAASEAMARFALAIQGADDITGAEDVLSSTIGLMQIQAEAFQASLRAQRELNDSFGSFFEFDEESMSIQRIVPTIQEIADAGSAILENASEQAQVTYAEIFSLTGDQAEAAARATTQSNNIVAQSFAALQTTLGLTDTEFERLLESAGLWDIFALSLRNSDGYIQSYFSDFAELMGLTTEALAELIGLQGEITEFTLITYGADTAEAIERLNELKELQNEIRSDSSELGIRFSNQVAEEIRDLGNVVTEGISAINPDLSKQEDALRKEQEKQAEEARKEAERQAKEREAAAKKLADEAKRLAEEQRRAQESWLKKLENALDQLANSMTQAVEGIQSAAREWTASIRERTQFERAVSVGTLTRNAVRQAADLEEVNAQIEGLLARGVSEAVLSSLDINNVTDLRQLRRLAGASDAELFALTSAVQRRDTAAVSIAENRQQQQLQNTITAAIIAAAQTLGFNRDQARDAAAQIAAQITVTASSDPESLARQIEEALLSLPAAGALRP